MGIAVALLAMLCAVLAALLAAIEWQQRRMARQLARKEDRLRGVRVAVRTPGAVALAQSLDAAAEDARRAVLQVQEERRRLQQDLAAFSHDARTPLTGAQGYLQLYAVAQDAEERDRCVAEASERLSAMRRLVDQLFELTKVEGGRSALEEGPLLVDEVLAECLAELYPAFVRKGWAPDVAMDEGVRAVADREALSRVFENLLANCLYHGADAPAVCLRKLPSTAEPQAAPADPGAPPVLTAADGAVSLQAVGWELVLSNRADNLRGLDPDLLFERFYRGDPSRPSGGSGLGLAIARGLSNAMGFQLDAQVDSACETFTIALRSV